MKVALVFASLLLSASVTQAQSVTKAAISGKSIRLFFANTTNPDCNSAGDTTVRVTRAPEHGRLDIKKASDFPDSPRGNSRRACKKRRVAGLLALYALQPGFIGTDYVSVEMFFADGAFARRNFTINVR
jgi:hypothetical protein